MLVTTIAVDFYSGLGRTDNVAAPQRTAITRLVKEGLSRAMYWRPFIHFGDQVAGISRSSICILPSYVGMRTSKYVGAGSGVVSMAL